MNDRVDGVAKSHAIANLRIAGGHKDGKFHGFRFQDGNVTRWLEAAAYGLEADRDESLQKLADQVIDHLADAQQTDGYLNTYITLAHPELELALAKLYEATGNDRYRKLASYFVDERGRQPNYSMEEAKARNEPDDLGHFGQKMFEYNLSHRPVREQNHATGHEVRAVYLYSTMADLALLNEDQSLAAV